LRVDILDQPAWEETILFACERASRDDQAGVAAVAAAIATALPIDPILAAEMIYRAAEDVWTRVPDHVLVFVGRWHAPGVADRAVRFMITSGRPEFAEQVWPLVENPDSQVHLTAMRAARRFGQLPAHRFVVAGTRVETGHQIFSRVKSARTRHSGVRM
jgi:hypothetical protein